MVKKTVFLPVVCFLAYSSQWSCSVYSFSFQSCLLRYLFNWMHDTFSARAKCHKQTRCSLVRKSSLICKSLSSSPHRFFFFFLPISILSVGKIRFTASIAECKRLWLSIIFRKNFLKCIFERLRWPLEMDVCISKCTYLKGAQT